MNRSKQESSANKKNSWVARFAPLKRGRKTQSKAICPYCKERIGVTENQYLFQLISFLPEKKKGKKKPDQEDIGFLVTYCQNCRKVMGPLR